MTQHAQFPQVFPALHHLPGGPGAVIVDGGFLDSRIIDITDPLSDPEDPLPDFGDALNISFTRSWRLSWAVRIDLIASPWAGTNRADLTLETINLVSRQALSEASEDLVRLFIPASNTARYVYTGSRIIHSQRARIHIQNNTGDDVRLDLDFWAKAW